MAQSYLSYFSTVFHWRIFLLSRANRLYSIFFFTLAWRTWVRLPATNPAQKLTFFSFFFFFADGEKGATSVLGPQPIIWLLPSSPPGQAILLGLLDVTQVRLLLIQTRGVVILSPSSQWDITWHYSARTMFLGQHKNGESQPIFLFLFRAGRTYFLPAPFIAAESQHHEESHLVYWPLSLFS